MRREHIFIRHLTWFLFLLHLQSLYVHAEDSGVEYSKGCAHLHCESGSRCIKRRFWCKEPPCPGMLYCSKSRKESLKGPQTCDTVRCSSGHICTIKVRECRWDESNFTFSWKWRQCTEQNFFFRMQTTNSSLRVGEGILRGCSFLRRFWMSVWETLHLARNLLRQSTLQAYQKLCGDARRADLVRRVQKFELHLGVRVFLTATGKQLSRCMVHAYVRLHVHRRSVFTMKRGKNSSRALIYTRL